MLFETGVTLALALVRLLALGLALVLVLQERPGLVAQGLGLAQRPGFFR